MANERISQRGFLGVAALLFAGSATLTVSLCTSMSGMGEMEMPGGWTMSMAWMRMPAQTWLSAAASFLAMWIAMMVAMMLPALIPALWRYREAIGPHHARVNSLTALVALGYFFVWTLVGLAAFPLGAALAAVEMQHPNLARAVPMAVGLIVLLAGAAQLTAWKARALACCRAAPDLENAAQAGPARPAGDVAAFRHGLRLGVRCLRCCGGLMAIPLVIGVMDLRAMAVVTVAIALERLVPQGLRVARAIGVVAIAAGVVLTMRAMGIARGG